MNYRADIIMANHELYDSDSSEDLSYLYQEAVNTQQTGGTNTIKSKSNIVSSIPTGGFPPIFILDDAMVENEKTKNRQFVNKNVGISIKNILNSKR
jgi:hypothetical protein